MSGPSNEPKEEGKDLADQSTEELHSLIQDLREEINQIRQSNAYLFRATAHEMELLREDNSNLTTVLVKLKADFDLMVSNFLEQRDKLRELEAWRIHVENSHIPNRGRAGVKNDQEDASYDELLDNQDESDKNENIQMDEEEENNQKQTSSANEDENYVAITPKSTANEEYELAEHVEVPTKIESMKDESLAAVHHPLFDDLALNDATKEDQEKIDLEKEDSMEIDMAERDLAVQGLAVKMGSPEEEYTEIEYTEADIIKIDLALAALNKDLAKKDSTVQDLTEERDSTDKESTEADVTEICSSKEGAMAEKELASESLVVTGSTNKEVADEEFTDKASSETGPAKVNVEKEDAMEIVLVEQDLAAEGSSEEMELANNTPTKDSSAKHDSKTDSFVEIDLAQTDITAASNSVEEKESIDKQSSNADLTETGTMKQDSMEIETVHEPIVTNVSADEKEYKETDDLKGESEIGSKESADTVPANDEPTDLLSNKEESTDPDLTQKDTKKVEESALNHSEMEDFTKISTREDLKEITALESNEKDIVQINSNDQEASVVADEKRDSAPKTNSPQISISDQGANATSISKPKRKYKNPIVLIKSKKRKLSLK